MPLAGRDADVKVTSLIATSSTNEGATRSTGVGAENGYVQITSAARRHLSPDVEPTLWVIAAGSTTQVSTALYSVNKVQGRFDWLSGDPTTGTYQADIQWLTATSVAGGREWSLNIEADMFEVSTFGSGGWKQYQPNLNGATCSIGRYWNDSTFIDYMNVDALFLVELTPNTAAGSTSARYEGYARVVSDNPQASVDSIVGETINMVVDGALYYTT